ncbi:MAG: hypothetical protein KAQ83_01990, partial [Nanoarchaeota archaeon]|nr:hypothetical protein [Nanoarchaeota archaeon]
YVGDVIDLEGTGYIPGDNLIILFDNEIIVTSSMGASGSFDTTFVVPDLAPGDYNINVYGTNMSSMYNVYEVFTILDNGTQPDYPSITLSAPGGHVGETRTVYGHDFLYVSSNETITIRMAGIIIAEFQWSDAEFEVDFVVPDLAPGNNYLVSVDNYPTAYAYFDVLEGPYFSELYVNPEQGYVGDVINIWGNDYPANDTLIIMMAGQVIATPTTDANGTFIDTFNVPNVPTGDYEITVVNRAGTADFEVLENVGPDESEIFVDPVSGYEGDVINVWGNNFNPNETVTLYLGANFIVNVNTDNTGSFTGVFTVPDVAAGLYNVMAVGYSATTPFLVLEQGGVEPDLFVSPTSGIPGDIIDLSGINFGANETLVIYLDSQIIATPTTDVNGAFLTTFVVPEWAADDYEITVFGYSVSEWFTINDWAEEEEEEEDDDYDDDWNDDIEREQHQYYMEGLTCSADVNVGEQAVLSLEVVNRGITDEDNMIVEVTCNDLGINIIMEDVLIERLEPNYMEIPLNIPANAEAGSYSCMVEIYSDYYVYEQVDRVLDSINIIVGQPVEYTGTEVIYMDAMEEEQESPDLNVSLFLLNIALLVIILVFVVLIIRSIRK